LGVQVQLVGGITLGNSGFTTSGAGLAGTVDGLFRLVSGNNTITGPVTLTGGGGSSTFRADAGATLTFSGNIGADTNTVRFINVVGDGNFAFGGVIAQTLTTGGSTGLWSMNSGVTRITGVANTYLLATGVGNGGTLEVALLANGGVASSIGAAPVAAANLILDNGTLKYVGTGAQSTNRLFSVGNGGGSLDASGATVTDTLSFAGTGSLGFSGSTGIGTSAIEPGSRTLTLTGANTGNNRLSLALIDQAADTGVTSLTKAGLSRWILDGANTYTGVTNVTNGVLNIQSAAALGSAVAGTVVASGATLQVQVTGVSSEAVSIAGSGAVGQTGALVSTLAGTNNFGAPVTLSAAATISSDIGTFTLSNAAGISGAGFNLSLGGAGDGTVTGAIGIGSGALIKAGAGNWTLSAASTYSGQTNINGGVLTVSHADALGSSAAGTTVATGAELRLTGGITLSSEAITLNGQGVSAAGALRSSAGSNTVSSAITLASAARINSDAATLILSGGVSSTNQGLTIGGAGNVTVSTIGLSLGTGGLTKDGLGILTLTSANAFGGGTTINAGELIITDTGSLGSGTVTVAVGATLNLSSLGVTNTITRLTDGTNFGTVTGGISSATISATAPAVISTVLTGTDGLTRTGGELTLSTPNFYTGATAASGASSVIKAAFLSDTSSSLGASLLTDPAKLVLGSGATLEFTGTTATTTTRSFTIDVKAGIATGSGASPLIFTTAAKIALVGANPELKLVANNSGTNIFRAGLTTDDITNNRGLSTLTIDGAGTWVIGGNVNRFKQDIRIDVAAGTTLGFESGSLGTGNTYASSVIRLNSNTVLVWSGANTDDISSRLQIPTGATAKMNLGSNDVEFASAPKDDTGAALTAGTIQKTGTGTLKIASTVTSPGLNFDVPAGAGKLTINGTVGNVTLAAGTTLGGSGTVGNATVALGATLSPGNSPGTLGGSTIRLDGGSDFDWQIQDATEATVNPGYDKLALTGNLDLRNASAGNKINLKVVSLAGSGNGTTTGNPYNFGPPSGVSSIRIFNFATVAGSVLLNTGEQISDVFQFDVTGFKYSDGTSSSAGLWSINWDSANHLVTVTAVPEPSTYGFGLGALALAAAAIRRRRKNQPKA
jgi:MYXO-CTERM domain-containing protein